MDFRKDLNDNILKLTLPESIEIIEQNALSNINLIQELIIPFVGESRLDNKFLGI